MRKNYWDDIIAYIDGLNDEDFDEILNGLNIGVQATAYSGDTKYLENIEQMKSDIDKNRDIE